MCRIYILKYIIYYSRIYKLAKENQKNDRLTTDAQMSFFTNILHKMSGRHVLTSQDRQSAAELNSLRFQIRRQELEREAEIKRLKDERIIKSLTAGDQEGQMLTGLLMTVLANNQSNAQVPKPTAEAQQIEPPKSIHLSDEEIENLIKQVPKVYLKAAKSASPDTIKQLIEQRIGPVDDDTLRRIINRLKA